MVSSIHTGMLIVSGLFPTNRRGAKIIDNFVQINAFGRIFSNGKEATFQDV